jgi:hypothetical protein
MDEDYAQRTLGMNNAVNADASLRTIASWQPNSSLSFQPIRDVTNSRSASYK